MTSAELLVRLTNLTVERRPGRGPAFRPDPLASCEGTAAALDLPTVTEGELAGLRELHRVLVALVDRVLAGQPVGRAAGQLTDLASPSHARVQLEHDRAGGLRTRLLWEDATLTSRLARQVVTELSEIDPARLRRCQRAPCRLVFYDTTRSNTKRWHAESPCGQRARQQRFRAGHAEDR